MYRYQGRHVLFLGASLRGGSKPVERKSRPKINGNPAKKKIEAWIDRKKNRPEVKLLHHRDLIYSFLWSLKEKKTSERAHLPVFFTKRFSSQHRCNGARVQPSPPLGDALQTPSNEDRCIQGLPIIRLMDG